MLTFLSFKKYKVWMQVAILSILSGIFQIGLIFGWILEPHYRERGSFVRYPHRYPFYLSILIVSILYFAIQLAAFIIKRKEDRGKSFLILAGSQILGHGVYYILILIGAVWLKLLLF